MQVGDLVRYYDGLNDHNEPGLVTKVAHWIDMGAPARNFGINIWVLWRNGDHQPFDPSELEVISEDRRFSAVD